MRRMFSIPQLEEIASNLLDSGKVASIKADSIIENMEGYSFEKADFTGLPISATYKYVGAVKNGNKLTLALTLVLTRTDSVTSTQQLGSFIIPEKIYDKLVPLYSQNLAIKKININANSYTGVDLFFSLNKASGNKLSLAVDNTGMNNMTANTSYYLRYEITFLLGENLAE